MHEHDVAGVHPRLHAPAVDGDVGGGAGEELRAQLHRPARDGRDERERAEDAPDAVQCGGHPSVRTSSGLFDAASRLSKTFSGASSAPPGSRTRKPLFVPAYIDATWAVTVHVR